ncbi:hypothetical protein [Nonomuraea sp. 10N515B]|uniref:hypothetical protein n=1 Tax=Nonomuraea sp. 10N515B TaxID=3457422 RepID=UPI003FCD9751
MLREQLGKPVGHWHEPGLRFLLSLSVTAALVNHRPITRHPLIDQAGEAMVIATESSERILLQVPKLFRDESAVQPKHAVHTVRNSCIGAIGSV